MRLNGLRECCAKLWISGNQAVVNCYTGNAMFSDLVLSALLGTAFRENRIAKINAFHSECRSRRLNDTVDSLRLLAFQFVKQV